MKTGEEKQENGKTRVALKPYTPKQLAAIYGVSAKTFRKWINPLKKELGKRIGWYYSIPQVKLIFSELSLPTFIELE